MKMISTSKILIIVLSFSLFGCASRNFLHSNDFQYYVSKNKYMNYSCNEVENIYEAFLLRNSKRDSKIVRPHMGIDEYYKNIPLDIQKHMLVAHRKALNYALMTKECKNR